MDQEDDGLGAPFKAPALMAAVDAEWASYVTEAFGPLMAADAESAQGALAPADELGAMESAIGQELQAQGALAPADEAEMKGGRRRRRMRGGVVTRAQFKKALADTAAAAQLIQRAAQRAAPQSSNIIGFAIRQCLANCRKVPANIDKAIANILKAAAVGAKAGALTYAVLHPTIITGPAKFLLSLVITLEKAVGPLWSTILPEYGLAFKDLGAAASGAVQAVSAYPAGTLFFAAAYYASRAGPDGVAALMQKDATAAKEGAVAAAATVAKATTDFYEDLVSLAGAEAGKNNLASDLRDLGVKVKAEMAARAPGAKASRRGDEEEARMAAAKSGGRRTRRRHRHRLSGPTRKGRRTSYGGRKRYSHPKRG